MYSIGQSVCSTVFNSPICSQSSGNVLGWGMLAGTAALGLLARRLFVQVPPLADGSNKPNKALQEPKNAYQDLISGIESGDLEKVRAVLPWCRVSWDRLKGVYDKNDRKMVKLLITRLDDQVRALDNACDQGLSYLAEKITKVVNPNYTHGIVRQSPLQRAINSGSYECCRALIEGKADVNMITSTFDSGRSSCDTPLSLACNNGLYSIAELLLKSGASLTGNQNDLKSPLMNAIQYPEIVKLLLKWKADVHFKRKLGDQVIHMAAQAGADETVLMLLNAGADREAPDRRGKTPLVIAQESLKELGDGASEAKRKGLENIIKLLSPVLNSFKE